MTALHSVDHSRTFDDTHDLRHACLERNAAGLLRQARSPTPRVEICKQRSEKGCLIIAPSCT